MKRYSFWVKCLAFFLAVVTLLCVAVSGLGVFAAESLCMYTQDDYNEWLYSQYRDSASMIADQVMMDYGASLSDCPEWILEQIGYRNAINRVKNWYDLNDDNWCYSIQKNGTVLRNTRTDAFDRDALRFVLENFRDLDGVVRGEEYLSLSSLAPDAPGIDEVIKCANLLLAGCGKAPDASLSADEIRESRIVTSFTDRNGDGVIAPESDLADELRRLIKAVIASGRTTPDRSGNDGISLADLESFEAALQRKLALFKAQEENPGILIYGEKTGELYRIFADCEGVWIFAL